MIITDKFVMLNYPKTGSSFARQVLKRVHCRRDTPLGRAVEKLGLTHKPGMIELLVSKGPRITHSQHGNYRQIPEEHKHKLIASIVRNPLQRYISEYLYGWWKKRPESFQKEIDCGFNNFPDLSFEDYYAMISLSARNESGKDIGYETVRFLKFFSIDPDANLSKLDDAYILSELYKADLPHIRFLRQESLNEDLFDLLSGLGYRHTDIQFIRRAERVNVTNRELDQSDANFFFKEELLEDVLNRDKLLFALFPEYVPAR